MHRWVFGDESGNFDFSPEGSRWYLTGTMSCDAEAAEAIRLVLRQLRERHASGGFDHDGVFHASRDRQAVRDDVFDVLVGQNVRVDVTLLEKRKAQPQLRESDQRFYKYAWLYHLRHVLAQVCRRGDTVHLVLSDIGTKKMRSAFREAVEDVVPQSCPPGVRYEVRYWKNAVDECLQAADYYLWAVGRHREGGDPRSYDLIHHLLKSEFDLFARGDTRYY